MFRRVVYATWEALSVDFGCVVGAVIFVLIAAGSVIFAVQITPCTTAAGVPCH
jgi:hypothetical protein